MGSRHSTLIVGHPGCQTKYFRIPTAEEEDDFDGIPQLVEDLKDCQLGSQTAPPVAVTKVCMISNQVQFKQAKLRLGCVPLTEGPGYESLFGIFPASAPRYLLMKLIISNSVSQLNHWNLLLTVR